MPSEAPTPCRENIVLVGFMGSGKSSIGRQLAKRLGFQFLDTDQLIVDRAGMEIAEIFARDGEAAFRDLETSVLASVAHLQRCVVATGGGAVVREQNQELMREIGFVVGLTAAEDVIYERVSRNNKRPLLQTADPRGTILKLLESRKEAYQSAAQFTLDTTNLSHAQAVESILTAARNAFGWSGQRESRVSC
ncbi:MAG TPA: shikimate kinase [Chthoniobacteraceae bacterium]|nr:shikimate kinase [Chthoniobacteraceae bacterium]